MSVKRQWVIKIGSALLTGDKPGLDRQLMASWVGQIAEMVRQGVSVVLVSSGSIAEGMLRLGWSERPHEVHKQQAAAAVGQMGLVQAYESEFQRYDLHTAQILLTHDDLSVRQRYLNARGTLRSLIGLGVVPIVNENDTVVTEEIRFGDNDTLAALVANLVEAERLVLLTDQQGLFDADPRKNTGAKLLSEVRAGDRSLETMAGSIGARGQGGMLTKIRAAEKAARSGTQTSIAYGRADKVLLRLLHGENPGTRFIADTGRVAARKQWLAGQLRCRGQLSIDEGAVRVLKKQGRSLLPVGVKAVDGRFDRGDLVACTDATGREVARGLVNYNNEECSRIAGLGSGRIEEVLGYVDEPELIHRDNMVVF